MSYTVYKHTSPSGKVYIGITCQRVAQRWKNGHGYKHSPHFQAAIEKYGWDAIQHEIIAENLTQEAATRMEVELIAQYDSNNPEKGYNLSTGGEYSTAGIRLSEERRRQISLAHKGRPLSEAHRKKLSESHRRENLKPETLRKMSESRRGAKNHNFGKPMSEEQRQKISTALSGRNHPKWGKPMNADHRNKLLAGAQKANRTRQKRVLCIETGVEYPSVATAAAANNTTKDKISAVCRGVNKTTRGLHFRFISDKAKEVVE